MATNIPIGTDMIGVMLVILIEIKLQSFCN